jgi:predicted dehydrogenase
VSRTVDAVRWGILGAAGIAESAFLPALARAGDGEAVVVGARDGARAERWAADHGVARGVEGYRAVVDDPEVEAVYVALPNGLHAEWTIAALEAGKAVLCEKPLCGTPEETERVLATARTAARPLWEAFVFPFSEQLARVRALLDDGGVGEVIEISSRFTFTLDDPGDIRLNASLAGGSIQDIGCYPIRLARLLFGAEPDLTRTIADATWTNDGVDLELWGALSFPGGRRLVLSCGFVGAYDTLTRVLGNDGEIRVSNAYHARPGDTVTVLRDGQATTHAATTDGEPSFTPALRHIHRALRGLEPPRHLAVDEAMGNAAAIASLLAAARAAAGRAR